MYYLLVLPDEVTQTLENLPPRPGVYVFHGADDLVLYVGKALSLRNRVRSYFQDSGSDSRFFIARLENELIRIETFVVQNEKEAVLLEHQLVKSLRPRYNVKLRDDKEYLSLRLDPRGQWPRLEVVRRATPDGAHYFGPYESASAARQSLRVINRHFQLRTCTDSEMAARKRPCLQYQIRRCPGPCVLPVDRERYGQQIESVALFLNGKHDQLVTRLETQMRESANALEYEQAAVFRDQINAVDRVRQKQSVVAVKDIDQDIVGFYREGDQAEMSLLMVREGKVVGVRTYDLRRLSLPDDEVVSSFVTELYESVSFVPDEVCVPTVFEAMDGLAEVLSDRKGRKVTVSHPLRGDRVRLMEMAHENAKHAFSIKARAREDIEQRLLVMQTKLRLPRLPIRIECVDISHLGGQDTVAAFVALLSGEPDRKRYRTFHIRGVSGGDDYGAMREAIRRRFARGTSGDGQWSLPDLLIVDGGRGQLGVALAVAKELGVADALPIAGLAKEKENVLGDKLVDRIYLPGQKNPIPLRDKDITLHFLARARDEAHRASNLARVKLGHRARLSSRLDSIPAVGPKTKAKLLQHFGDVDRALGADEATLRSLGLTKKQIEAIRSVHAEAPVLAETEGVSATEMERDPDELAEDEAVLHAFEETSSVEEEQPPQTTPPGES